MAAKLDADAAITTVFATQSERPRRRVCFTTIAKETRSRGKRLVVDAITGVGVHPLPQDEWGVDVVVTGSQKGLMSPPGVATVSLAPWALDAIEASACRASTGTCARPAKSLPGRARVHAARVAHLRGRRGHRDDA